jgi:hypothetical protein
MNDFKLNKIELTLLAINAHLVLNEILEEEEQVSRITISL